MSDTLEVAKVLVSPVNKLLDMIGSAVGKLYEPTNTKRTACADAYKVKKIAEAMDECINLPITYQNGDIRIDSSDTNNLVQRAQNRALFQEMKSQCNIEAIANVAYKELEHSEPVEDTPVDEDWATRFFNIAKEISSEDMQHIWGKILAGEVAEPGSFSLRTLETVRNLSRDEAMSFQKIIPLVILNGSGCCIAGAQEINNKHNISYNEILMLDEAGLIMAGNGVAVPLKRDEKSYNVFANKNQAIVIDTLPDMEIEMPLHVYPFTNAGNELYTILSCQPDENIIFDIAEYMLKTIRKFSRNTKGTKIFIRKVIEAHDRSFDLSDENIREYHS